MKGQNGYKGMKGYGMLKKIASGSGSTGEEGQVLRWKGVLGPAVKNLTYGDRAVEEHLTGKVRQGWGTCLQVPTYFAPTKTFLPIHSRKDASSVPFVEVENCS